MRRRSGGISKYTPLAGVPFQRQSGDKATKLIEFIFQREAAIRQAVEEKRISGTNGPSGMGTRRGAVPDPTAVSAIRNIIEMHVVGLPNGEIILWPEQWLKVIDSVRTWCQQDEINAKIFRCRYELREHYKTTVVSLGIEKSQYYQRLLAIRTQAKIDAILRGLIKKS